MRRGRCTTAATGGTASGPSSPSWPRSCRHDRRAGRPSHRAPDAADTRSMTAHQPADPSVPAVLLKLGGEPLPHGALAAARTLGRLGVPVHVVPAGPSPALAGSRYVSSFTRLGDHAPECDVMTALTRIAAGCDTPPVLIWTDDIAALLAAEHTDDLRLHYRFPVQPFGLTHSLCDKLELCRLA